MSGHAVPFLSFNDASLKARDFGLPDEKDEAVVQQLREPIELKDKWVLWEQLVQGDGKNMNFGDAIKEVVTFSTLQDFWKIWNGLPQPSELLEQRRIMRDRGGGPAVAIDAIMIFKDGVTPAWEDPENASGGHYHFQMKPSQGPGQIDEYWNNIVLGMIGGTIQPAELITGIRLVDKLSGVKGANLLRIELWSRKDPDKNDTNIARLRVSMENCLATRLDGSRGTAPKPDWKPHSNIKH